MKSGWLMSSRASQEASAQCVWTWSEGVHLVNLSRYRRLVIVHLTSIGQELWHAEMEDLQSTLTPTCSVWFLTQGLWPTSERTMGERVATRPIRTEGTELVVYSPMLFSAVGRLWKGLCIHSTARWNWGGKQIELPHFKGSCRPQSALNCKLSDVSLCGCCLPFRLSEFSPSFLAISSAHLITHLPHSRKYSMFVYIALRGFKSFHVVITCSSLALTLRDV